MHAHIPPLLLNETNGQRQPTVAVASTFTLPCTGNTSALPDLDSPVPKPSILLAYFSVLLLMLIVRRALQTTRMHGFVSSLFDIPGEYRGQRLDEFSMWKGKMCACGLAGAVIIRNPTRNFSSPTFTRYKAVH